MSFWQFLLSKLIYQPRFMAHLEWPIRRHRNHIWVKTLKLSPLEFKILKINRLSVVAT